MIRTLNLKSDYRLFGCFIKPFTQSNLGNIVNDQKNIYQRLCSYDGHFPVVSEKW